MSDTPINDGGPAFPVSNGVDTAWGMTLRDWFAGQWIAAGNHANLTPREAAGQAYESADAMLAAREVKP